MDRLNRLRHRASLADQDDENTWLHSLILRSRTQGPRVYLECLADLNTWKQSSQSIQDVAIEMVGELIGSDFSHLHTRDWFCENRTGPDSGPMGELGHSNRCATFIHKATGIEFQLLPGRPGIGYELKADPDHPGCNTADVFGPEDERYGEVGGTVFYGIEPFLIARWPVTNDQAWRTHPRNGLGEDGMYDTDAAKGPLPATGASFEDVKEYAESNGLSLPTAVQWEYACKAGSENRFYFGDEFDPSHVWFAGNSGEPSCGTCIAEPSINHPHPPKIISHAEHEAAGKWNAFGLVDMIGNVFEWVDPGHTYSSSYLYSRQLTEANFLYPNAQNSESLHDVGFRPIKTIDWSDK